MTIQTNTTDRKALVQAIAEELHTDFRYLGTPSYAYEVGDFTVDHEGNIVGDDFTPLMGFLVQGGYITEDALTAQVMSEEATAEEEAPVEEPAAEPAVDSTEDIGATDGADSDADSEAPTPMLNDIDTQSITIPAPNITVEQLRNLTYILYSRQYILNLMTGGDTVNIPLELIEALQEALPATPEDFSTLLDNHRALGLKGFDFRDGKFTLDFPFYETEPTKWTAFAGLQGRILLAAREAKRVFPELIHPDEEAEKYIAHIWLQRLGYKGPEMKAQRNILLKHLHGYCAFSNGAKMQNHKEKYSVIRKERREAERTAAQTVDETITPAATEAGTAVTTDGEEVDVND